MAHLRRGSRAQSDDKMPALFLVSSFSWIRASLTASPVIPSFPRLVSGVHFGVGWGEVGSKKPLFRGIEPIIWTGLAILRVVSVSVELFRDGSRRYCGVAILPRIVGVDNIMGMAGPLCSKIFITEGPSLSRFSISCERTSHGGFDIIACWHIAACVGRCRICWQAWPDPGSCGFSRVNYVFPLQHTFLDVIDSC